MIDINLTSRDLYGKVTFGVKNANNSGIEILLQKIVSLILSNNKKTYFGNIIGGNVTNVTMYNFGKNNDDFKINIADSLLNIKKILQQEDVKNNTPYNDRLKNIILKDVLFDRTTQTITLSLSVSTNSSFKLINLPVK